jgi:hypothetical protein
MKARSSITMFKRPVNQMLYQARLARMGMRMYAVLQEGLDRHSLEGLRELFEDNH